MVHLDSLAESQASRGHLPRSAKRPSIQRFHYRIPIKSDQARGYSDVWNDLSVLEAVRFAHGNFERLG